MLLSHPSLSSLFLSQAPTQPPAGIAVDTRIIDLLSKLCWNSTAKHPKHLCIVCWKKMLQITAPNYTIMSPKQQNPATRNSSLKKIGNRYDTVSIHYYLNCRKPIFFYEFKIFLHVFTCIKHVQITRLTRSSGNSELNPDVIYTLHRQTQQSTETLFNNFHFSG